MKLRVLILGYGEMGHALEFLLSPKHEVRIWSRNSPLKLEEEARQAQVIIFCLPVSAHGSIAKRISTVIASDCLCLTIAKGLDEGGLTAAAIFSGNFTDRCNYGVIYGPMISEEIRRDRYAFADVALSAPLFTNLVEQLFSGSKLICRFSDDITGSSWSVILKNVYAILFGVADGLQLGDNIRGYLAVAALAELSDIVQALGGKALTPYGFAGLGDLITTATSPDSHHHELGRKLALNIPQEISGEGVHTIAMVNKYQLINTQVYPLLRLASQLIENPDKIQEITMQFLQKLPATLTP